jgi:tetratricopeptide (TPR) repeat protein
MNVGSIVRIRRRPGGMTQRAMIATLEGDSACVLLLEEDPQPIHPSAPFRCAPSIRRKVAPEAVGTEEVTLPKSSIVPSLDFEQMLPQAVDQNSSNGAWNLIQQWKQRGDELLQLQDFVAAVPYYEYALHLSTSSQNIQIGATVLIQEGGYIRAAEVDCMEGAKEDTTIHYDVTMVESGAETTLSQKEILLGLLDPHADHLQERCLLNLSRCLLHWIEASSPDVLDSTKRRAIVQGAVLATSLSWTIATIIHRQEEESANDALSKLQISALMLRSQAQLHLQKHAHALADVQKVLQAFPDHKEATALLKKLQRQKKHVQKTNQRLAKHMSQWVQSALQLEQGATTPGHDDDVVRAPEPNRTPSTKQSPSLIMSWMFPCAVVVCVLAWLSAKMISPH